MTKFERVTCIFLFSLFSAAFLIALSFPAEARTYPLLVLGMGAVLTAYFTLRGEWGNYKRKSDATARAKFIEKEEKNKLSSRNVRDISITVVITGLYTILMPVIGYFPSTFFFMTALMAALKKNFRWLYVIVAVVFCLLMYVTFVRFLHIALPYGWVFTFFY